MEKFILWLIRIVVVGLVIGAIAYDIWFFKEYGNKPVSEMPIWVYWAINSGK